MATLQARLRACLKSFLNPDSNQELPQNSVPSPSSDEPTSPRLEPEIKVVFDNQLLANKNVLITGAGQNIGKSIALEMAKQGANIYFTDIESDRITALEQELSTYSIQKQGYLSDISKTEDSDALYQDLLEKDISIDILVNNVGIQFETVGIENLKLQEWQETFNTNVFGPLYLTKLITQTMIEKKIQGSVIFITSIHQEEIVRWPSYSASKAALKMTINEIAVDLAPHGIRVNSIAPAWVAVDAQGNTLSHKYHLLSKSSIPPCYIGRAAVYLASEYFSQYTTGTTIKIDSGATLYNYRVAQTLPV
jgi:NAD(P)-dependent dehydrogenase (short-subunit alcohol dehydrogenase family)